MGELPDAIQEIYDRYAEIDRLRGDYRYLQAARSMTGLYERLGRDRELFQTAIDAIIEDYEDKQDRIPKLLSSLDFSAIRRVIRQLESSIRPIVSEDVIEQARDCQRASASKNLPDTYESWSILHQKLYPILILLRQLRKHAPQ